jgi:LacI family transcriptional regulator
MAQKHHYVANASARSLKARSTNVIAVLIQGGLSPIFLPMIRMFQDQIEKTEFSLMLTFISDEEAEQGFIARVVRDRKISGVIFLGRYGDESEGALSSQQLADMGTPIVFCTTSDFSGSLSPHSSVSIDDRAGSAAITTLVLERGHRRIAYLGAGDPGDAEQVWALRVAGFRDAVSAFPEHADAQVLAAAVPHRLYTMENGYETMRRALDDGFDATAIVAMCDTVAVGAIKALSERGLRVPEDVSVTGFDDIDYARYSVPGLTTVSQPLQQIVTESTRILLDIIADPDHRAEIIRLHGPVIERGSVGDPSPRSAAS